MESVKPHGACTTRSECRDTIQMEERIANKILVKKFATCIVGLAIRFQQCRRRPTHSWERDRNNSGEVSSRRIGSESLLRGEPARDQGAFGPLVEARPQSAHCVLDRRILGDVALFKGVLGEMIQLFAAFNLAAQVGPL